MAESDPPRRARLASEPAGDAGERLSGPERVLVAEFLAGAPMVIAAWGSGTDPRDGDAVVPLHIHTDGLWVWSESLAYHARRYGTPPEPEFLAHIRSRRYRWPDVTDEVIDRAADLLTS